MADGCDDPLVRSTTSSGSSSAACVVAAASRYMPGGQQVGGPRFKGILSRVGGPDPAHVRRRRHARRDQLLQGVLDAPSCEEVGIESRAGFEIGLELVAKARRLRLPVAEIPTIWLDRDVGVSNFQLPTVDPGVPALVPSTPSAGEPAARRELRIAHRHEGRSHREGSRHRLGRLHRRLRRRGAARPRLRGRRGRQPTRSTARSRKLVRRQPRLHASSRATSRTPTLMVELLSDVDHVIAGAAHDRRHLVLPHLRLRPARRERADHRLHLRRGDRGACTAGRPLQKVTYLSSSMVFESHRPLAVARGRRARGPAAVVVATASRSWPSSTSPARRGTSTSCPTRSCRPFNCVGIGERRALGDVEIESGNVKLAMSHVVPDLVQKVAQGPGPAAHPRRRASRSATTPTAATSPGASSLRWSTRDATNEDFNLSTPSRPPSSSWPS